MKPTVFISHSCKDREEAPPAGLSPAKTKARQRRLEFARRIRDEIRDRLTAIQGLEVFVDVRGLNAGDIWQDGLHKKLRSCSGAVVLLSPESLESGWVLKEATILSWRVFLGEPVVLVPVVVGVSDEQIRDKGFGAVNLDAIQWIKVRNTSDAELERAVAKVVEVLAPVAQGGLRSDRTEWATTAERWLVELADALREATPEERSNTYLTLFYRALSVRPQDRDRGGDDPFQDIATLVLTSKAAAVLKVLAEVSSANRSQRKELQARVRPLWVDAGAANPLPHLARQAVVIAIDGDEVETARDYVNRAYCTRIPADRLFSPNDTSDGSRKHAIKIVEDELEKYLPIDDIDELKADIADFGPAFVILGPGLARSDVLETLTDKYTPPLTFVVMAGAEPAKRLGSWVDRVLLLRPSLQPKAERGGRRYRNRLKAFVDART